MTYEPPAPQPAEPDPVLHLVQTFLGAATTLFVELCLLLVPDVLHVALAVLFGAGALLCIRERSRWAGVGMMIGVVVPLLYVVTYVK